MSQLDCTLPVKGISGRIGGKTVGRKSDHWKLILRWPVGQGADAWLTLRADQRAQVKLAAGPPITSVFTPPSLLCRPV